ncbi:serine incorporator-domain-containing protein [Gautieria morchelliformis]|nr:serine incorporator-domain-containing protein [Gautieria morchelliformis]
MYSSPVTGVPSIDSFISFNLSLCIIITIICIHPAVQEASRAATQSRALVGRHKKGVIQLTNDTASDGGVTLITSQPSRTEMPRYQALLAAVEVGAITVSALDEEDVEDEDDGIAGEERDDERTGTRYNYAWFHAIFLMGAMYVAMLLTDWKVLKATEGDPGKEPDFYIGRSKPAMWMRVMSSWVCMVLYIWSLVAPVLMPDQFGD